MKRTRLIALLTLFVIGAPAQLLDPKKLLERPTDTWPTYNGDYSGQRYSPLKQISVV